MTYCNIIVEYSALEGEFFLGGDLDVQSDAGVLGSRQIDEADQSCMASRQHFADAVCKMPRYLQMKALASERSTVLCGILSCSSIQGPARTSFRAARSAFER